MKTAVLIARIVLGFVFLVFGLNGFLQFLPQPAMPQGAGSFFGALAASGYMLPLLFATQIVGGALVLVGMVPLGLVILARSSSTSLCSTSFLRPTGCRSRPSSARLRCFWPGGIGGHTARCSCPAPARRPDAVRAIAFVCVAGN